MLKVICKETEPVEHEMRNLTHSSSDIHLTLHNCNDLSQSLLKHSEIRHVRVSGMVAAILSGHRRDQNSK